MKLAWNNLLEDRTRFLVTVLGVAFAVFLMLFQGSLLFGFLQASSKLIDTADGDLWITARGVACFDFSATLPRRFVEIALGVPGVSGASRLVTGAATYRTGQGQHHVIALVGAEQGVGKRFPLPLVRGSANATEPDGVVVDRSNAALLGVGADRLGERVEINNRRGRLTEIVSGFSSFLGSPYVFASYPDAVRYLGLGREESMYILLRLEPGADAALVQRAVRQRLPEADVWTRAEFSARSQRYWVTQTGAGAGILLAAILGFVIGLVIVSQSIYATTMENIEEYATLRALGATRWFVMRVVLLQGLACGIVGSLAGVAAAMPVIDEARAVIAWIATPGWLPAAMIVPSLALCSLAAVISIRAAWNAEPARVFRA